MNAFYEIKILPLKRLDVLQKPLTAADEHVHPEERRQTQKYLHTDVVHMKP